MFKILRDAAILTLGASALGLGVNVFHPRGIPLVAKKAYETLAPCPVPGGEVTVCQASDPLLTEPDSLLIDARRTPEFTAWHLPGAVNVVYDYLESVPQEKLKELSRILSEKRARRLVVYGDGQDPDSGEQLGRELSGAGFKNVVFVKGGAPALRAATQEEARP